MRCNVIPPITDPLGKYWDQPSAERILLDDTHALMETETFKALAEYSASIPSGVYDGKMWKRRNGGGERPEWLLVWFGPSTKPATCSINSRKILLV